MPQLFEYRDASLYCHHSLDLTPPQLSMHAHEMYEIFYFLSGDCTCLVEGQHYRLQPQDLLLMRSAEAHRIVLHSAAPYERIAILFSPSLLRPLDPGGILSLPFTCRSLGMHNLYRAEDGKPPPWRIYFDEFDLFASPERQRLHVIGRILGILTCLSGEMAQDASNVSPAADLPRKIIEYVNVHLFQELSLQTVCTAFSLSRSQVSRLFRQTTGASCGEYIQIKRLLVARELLRQGIPAASICAQCGFHDYSAFYRAYRARFGCAPTVKVP